MGSALRTEWLIGVKESSKYPADQKFRQQESDRDGKEKIGQLA